LQALRQPMSAMPHQNPVIDSERETQDSG